MPRFFRQLSIGLVVTLLVALQGFAVRDGQHRLEHALQFPGEPYVQIAPGDHDPGHAPDDHHHDEVDAAADTAPLIGAAFDGADQDGDVPPVSHHHHGGADPSLTLVLNPEVTSRADPTPERRTPAPDSRRPGTRPDSPLDPPRQHA